MIHLHTDIETYATVPFGRKKGAVGLDVYAKHPDTEIMMGAGAIDKEPVWQTDDVEYYLLNLYELSKRDDVLFHAFNAPFERTLLREVGGIDIPIERWRCTMVHAYTLGFSGGLADVGKQMGLPQDKQKLSRGGRLIDKFCSPAPRNHIESRYTKENAPDDWQDFCDYNTQDVVTERELRMLLDRYPMPEQELELWFADQRINDRGLPVDRELVDAALEIYHAEKRHLTAELKTLTGLANPNSVPQLMAWFQAKGWPMKSLAADEVTQALLSPPWEMPDLVRRALELRQQAARTAGSKWEAFLRTTDWDTARVRHCFQFGGAQRTGRWGGRNLQPHNLHRSPWDQDRKVESML